MKEDILCAIFAENVQMNAEFRAWLLTQTKFHQWANQAILLADEQGRRPAKSWWRHWWITVQENNRQSETDIFLVFEKAPHRFALHIENKLKASLSDKQASDYKIRAEQMKSNKWVPYTDFQTIIIAPRAYLDAKIDQCLQFYLSLSYEEIGNYLKEFMNALGLTA